MNEKNDTALLADEIAKTRQALDRIDANYRKFLETDFVSLGKTTTSAIVVTEMLVNYYTCLETLFLRISQHFENRLQTDKWHSDLLHKMTLAVQGERVAVLSDETYSNLAELLRFRHFKRYYFDFEYDWDKIEYLQKKYAQAKSLVAQDLDRFVKFLQELAAE